MELNIKKIDEDLKDGSAPARRFSKEGSATLPIPITTEDEQLDDIAIAEAVAEVEAEIKSEEKKNKQLPDYLLFNVAFGIVIVAFWLAYFKFI